MAVAHGMHAEAPVVVGSVVWPAAHGEQASDDTACVTVENFPATHPLHFLVAPSLYRPGVHAVHVELHGGQAVSPFANLAAPVASHRTHDGALAALAVPGGQAWHAVLALALENFPAAQVAHAVPEIMLPGAQALQTVTVPPGEYWVGRGHWAQAPAALVYWPEGHTAERAGVVDAERIVNNNESHCTWGIESERDSC